MKFFVQITVSITLLASSAWFNKVFANECGHWPQWETFKTHFISRDGRVIDLGSDKNITTSEGQSYGLFFALLANDQESFDKLLNWTERHLSEGDLSARLPAWLWGKRDNGDYGILDSNPASDSDLWIAYALAEAGRVWQERRYSVLAAVMAKRILKEETAYLPGLGLTLLPAPYGFELDNDVWRLNPSYMPDFILQHFVNLYPSQPWQELVNSSLRVVTESARKGASPDWVLYSAKKGFHYTRKHADIGNFNAIRSYLWAGMLAENAQNRAVLLKALSPMSDKIVNRRSMPLNTFAKTGNVEKQGPIGFQAAALPFLLATNEQNTAEMLFQRVQAGLEHELKNNYYSSVLALFGTAYYQERFSLTADGQVITNWSTQCE